MGRPAPSILAHAGDGVVNRSTEATAACAG